MDKNFQEKSKKRAKGFIVGFIILVSFPFLILQLGNYYANPADKYRSEGASSTAHTIFIDDHYHVSTTSGQPLLIQKHPAEYFTTKSIA